MTKQWITAADWRTVADDVKSGLIILCDSYGDRVVGIEGVEGNPDSYRVINHPEDLAGNMGRQSYIVVEGSRFDHFYIPFGILADDTDTKDGTL